MACDGHGKHTACQGDPASAVGAIPGPAQACRALLLVSEVWPAAWPTGPEYWQTRPKSSPRRAPPTQASCSAMGVQKRTRKFGQAKRLIGEPFGTWTLAPLTRPRPARCQTVCDHHPSMPAVLTRPYRKKNQMAGEIEAKKKEQDDQARREMYATPVFHC